MEFLNQGKAWYGAARSGRVGRGLARFYEFGFRIAELLRQTRLKELQDLSFDLPMPGATLVGKYADDNNLGLRMRDKKKIDIVYCTKYALTKGIIQVSGYELDSGRFMQTEGGLFQSLHKNEWSRNGGEALELATEMRDRKIKSIERQRNKLLQMGFKLPDKLNMVGTKTERFPE